MLCGLLYAEFESEGCGFYLRVSPSYSSSENKGNDADWQIGLALRMAISLGLHQEVSDPEISEEYRDRRRRAWWSVYSLDRYFRSHAAERSNV